MLECFNKVKVQVLRVIGLKGKICSSMNVRQEQQFIGIRSRRMTEDQRCSAMDSPEQILKEISLADCSWGEKLTDFSNGDLVPWHHFPQTFRLQRLKKASTKSPTVPTVASPQTDKKTAAPPQKRTPSVKILLKQTSPTLPKKTEICPSSIKGMESFFVRPKSCMAKRSTSNEKETPIEFFPMPKKITTSPECCQMQALKQLRQTTEKRLLSVSVYPISENRKRSSSACSHTPRMNNFLVHGLATKKRVRRH